MLHYNPRHVSSSTMLIFRWTNCIIRASGIVTLEIGERSYINKMRFAVLQSALHLHTVGLLAKSDDTRGCGDTICSPDDEQHAARNMLRIVV